MSPRAIWLVAKSVLVEAVRRKEIYAIVLVSVLIIGAVMTVDFFELRGLTKFYAEVALKIMSTAAALTVVALAVRQLPREFQSRTIYPLLAKPVSRSSFLLGKTLGVLLAAAFALMLFMGVYIAGSLYLRSELYWGLLGQFIYLQLIGLLVLATLGLWLSLVMNTDAAFTLAAILYFTSNVLSSATTYLYHNGGVGPVVKYALAAITFVVPQLFLFDLTEKAVHGEAWSPLGMKTMALLTAYGLFFAGLFWCFAMISFRRRAL